MSSLMTAKDPERLCSSLADDPIVSPGCTKIYEGIKYGKNDKTEKSHAGHKHLVIQSKHSQEQGNDLKCHCDVDAGFR